MVRIPCDGCVFNYFDGKNGNHNDDNGQHNSTNVDNGFYSHNNTDINSFFNHNNGNGYGMNNATYPASDLVLYFDIPETDRTIMTLNDLEIIPTAHSSQGHQLMVSQMPQEMDSMHYIMQRDRFPSVPVNHSRVIRQVSNMVTGTKKYDLTLNIASVNHTDVTLKGLQMTIFEDQSHILHFGPFSAIPKSESCGLDVNCIISKIFHEAPTVPAPWTPGKMPACGMRPSEITEEEPEPQDEDIALPPLSSIPLSSIPIHPQFPLGGEPRQNMFRRIVRQIILPVFVGIAVGMAVSLFGLIVGHIFVVIWRRVTGRRSCRATPSNRGFLGRFRRQRFTRDIMTSNLSDGEVEKALLPESEAPPAYADDVDEEDGDAIEKE
jgi:hypothetical protein